MLRAVWHLSRSSIAATRAILIGLVSRRSDITASNISNNLHRTTTMLGFRSSLRQNCPHNSSNGCRTAATILATSRQLHPCHACSSRSIRNIVSMHGGGSNSISSSLASEATTRTVLGWSAALIQSGFNPTAICTFASASEAASLQQQQQQQLPSSIRVVFSPVSGDTAEQLSDCLLGFGAQSVVVEEWRLAGQAEQEVFGAEAELWDNCQVLAHFPLEHDVAATVSTVQSILDLPTLTFSQQHVVDQEWVQQIKASYVPVQIAEHMFIVPEWSQPTDETALNIRLTPGVAFGTGEHPTTKLCLRYLATQQLEGCTICDYGTGSGVLAIAGLLLGGTSAVGTDTDPLAVRAAQANAALNGVEGRLTALQCGANLADADPLEQLPDAHSQQQQQQQYDVVIANILRGPLLELQPRLSQYCRPAGRLALSGILTEQAADVIDAYSPYFEDFQVTSDGGWALVTATRKVACGLE